MRNKDFRNYFLPVVLIIIVLIFYSCALDIHQTTTVHFDSQGGTNTQTTSKTIEVGTEYGELPIPEKEQNLFGGWWTEPDGKGSQVFSFSVVEVSYEHTLFAFWGEKVTITFNAQGGVNLNPTNKDVMYNGTYGELATTLKLGHTLSGWWTNSEGTETRILPESKVLKPFDHVLYAKWELQSFNITFDSQGGSETNPIAKLVSYGEPFGDLPSPIKEGYKFAGWWTEPNGAGEKITESTILLTLIDFKVYAYWVFDVFPGPAGGLVFYENPNYAIDGWKYLEAAPYGWHDDGHDPELQWGALTGSSVQPSAAQTFIGAGYSNTNNIVAYHDTLWIRYPEKGDYYTNPGKYNTANDGIVAAKVCTEYSVELDGEIYNDWFLPSRDELELMYRYLYKQGLGGGFGLFYWSSSERSSQDSWIMSFYNGRYDYYSRSVRRSVRPIRAY